MSNEFIKIGVFTEDFLISNSGVNTTFFSIFRFSVLFTCSKNTLAAIFPISKGNWSTVLMGSSINLVKGSLLNPITEMSSGTLYFFAFNFLSRLLGCDFFEQIGEKRIDVRQFCGYVCHIAKFWLS